MGTFLFLLLLGLLIRWLWRSDVTGERGSLGVWLVPVWLVVFVFWLL